MVELYYYKNKKITRLSDLKEKRDELAVTFGLDNKIYAMGNYICRYQKVVLEDLKIYV